tara:strand:+ start:1701 stop:1943 length:243 start_codon:yes stop_codon:yes gene_type:complete
MDRPRQGINTLQDPATYRQSKGSRSRRYRSTPNSRCNGLPIVCCGIGAIIKLGFSDQAKTSISDEFSAFSHRYIYFFLDE